MGLKDYVVLYSQPLPFPCIHVLFFHCQAVSAEYAEIIFRKECPRCVLKWIHQGNDIYGALNEYLSAKPVPDNTTNSGKTA